jgi:2-oxoglutarate ferredoxin oxidoreductase subunit alpha
MVRNEYTVLIGGQAGDGIKQAGNAIARLFNRLGYWIFVYEDYPSLIRGGHNFAVIRAAPQRIIAHKDKVDVLIALNQDTIAQHTRRLSPDSLVIFDSSAVKAQGLAVPMGEMVKSKNLPPIVRNTAALAVLGAVTGADFSIVEDVIRSATKRSVEENIAVAKEAYAQAGGEHNHLHVPVLDNPPKPLLNGNEAIALGAVKGGMRLHVAYPMTPSSPILHYLAAQADRLNITTIHPESEIAVIGIAQGAAYAGVRSMVATSGGGFALMVEHFSLAGQAEIPTVVVLGQRPGPSTGLPTYTDQADLFFALYAGHGEFPRVVVAPGDAEQAFELTAEAMNLAWKFQSPVILLSDKELGESTFSTVLDENVAAVKEPPLWDGGGEYKRYALTDDGVSPLAFPGDPRATVKSNSYEHDEMGITTEESPLVIQAREKRLRKGRAIEAEIRNREAVRTYGNPESDIVLVTWGSTKGPVVEVAENLGLKVVQPLYLQPLPVWELEKPLGTPRPPGDPAARPYEPPRKVIAVEVNSTGRLCTWLRYHGHRVDESILKYDGRPFAVDELEEKVKGVLQ